MLARPVHELAREGREETGRPGDAGRYRRERNLEMVAAGAFFLSALPVFWTVAPLLDTSRFYFWIAPFVLRRGCGSWDE